MFGYQETVFNMRGELKNPLQAFTSGLFCISRFQTARSRPKRGKSSE